MIDTNLKILIKDLNQHSEYIPLLADWHRQQWSNSGHDRTALISSRTGVGNIPKTFVAMCEGAPVGFVCLLVSNAPSRPDLTPWLASLFVKTEFRNAGIGKALLQHCSDYAAEIGFSRIYLYTSTAVDYYKRLGWNQIDNFDIHGKSKIILSRSCSNLHP